MLGDKTRKPWMKRVRNSLHKKNAYKISRALKFRCWHADADLKWNIEGYNYWETTLMYIYIKEPKPKHLNVSMRQPNIGNPPLEDSSWSLDRNIHVCGMGIVVNILHIYLLDYLSDSGPCRIRSNQQMLWCNFGMSSIFVWELSREIFIRPAVIWSGPVTL